MGFINDDITWCYDPCDNMDCFRNVKHLEGKEGRFRMARLEGTGLCPKAGEVSEGQKADAKAD